LDLIEKNPNSKFFDKKDTDVTEDAGALIRRTFKETVQKHQQKQESWETRNKVSIMHLSQLLALSKVDFSSSGHPNALNAISKNWGPSMRMIVTMGKRPKAIGTMAGGPSGNPASPFYDSFVQEWLSGKYHEMSLFYSKEEAKRSSKIVWSSK
jgi:penicillin amidase